MATKTLKSSRHKPYPVKEQGQNIRTPTKKVVQNVRKLETENVVVELDKIIKTIEFRKKNASFEKLLNAEKSAKKAEEQVNLLKVKVPNPIYFVLVFNRPTYVINILPKSNETIIECTNINENLLFPDKDSKIINRLSVSDFKVSLNNNIKDNTIKSVTYEKTKTILKIVIDKYNGNIQKCIIYYCIFKKQNISWTVPQYLIKIFND
jgi:hypothetical protein